MESSCAALFHLVLNCVSPRAPRQVWDPAKPPEPAPPPAPADTPAAATNLRLRTAQRGERFKAQAAAAATPTDGDGGASGVDGGSVSSRSGAATARVAAPLPSQRDNHPHWSAATERNYAPQPSTKSGAHYKGGAEPWQPQQPTNSSASGLSSGLASLLSMGASTEPEAAELPPPKPISDLQLPSRKKAEKHNYHFC